MNRISYKILLLAGMAITGVSLIWFTITSPPLPDKTHTSKNSQHKTGYRYAKPAQNIKDFKYNGYAGSTRLLSIQCRNLMIHRKKTGFIRFALMKEAVLDQGVIQFHNCIGTKTATTETDTTNPNTAGLDAAGIQKSLGTIISKNSNLLSNFQNVSSIIIRPVTIEFYNKKTLATSISALYSAINLTRQKIIFKKNVIVISGNRKLMLDRLELNPENGLLTGTDYVLYSPEGKIKGKRITTDINLQKVYE